MAAIQGWGGRVIFSPLLNSIGGTSLPVTDWSVSITTPGIDATTMSNSGMEDIAWSVTSYDISFSCIYDTTLNPFNFLPGINVGIDLTTGDVNIEDDAYCSVTLFMDKSNTRRSFYFPRIFLTSMRVTDEVRGVVRYAVDGKNTRDTTFSVGHSVFTDNIPSVPSSSPG